MNFTEKIINKLAVQPVQSGIGKWDKTNVKGYDIFPNSPFWNTFITAKKKSGKSSLINLITQKCVNKNTVVWVFCATYQLDPTWKEIISELEKKGNLVNCYDSIIDGKINILEDIIDEINKEEEEEEELPKKTTNSIVKFYNETEANTKMYKPKKIAPENLFIFDDLPAIHLRNQSIARLLKIHRHSKSSVIISSQYILDIQPQSILQLDYFIAFKGLSEEKMRGIHKLFDLSIDFPEFWKIYKHCTEEPYSFMYVSIRDEKFRCKLNKEINLM